MYIMCIFVYMYMYRYKYNYLFFSAKKDHLPDDWKHET